VRGCPPIRAIEPAELPADRDDARIATWPDSPGSASLRGADSPDEQLLPTPPAPAAAEALQLFCDDLLQDVPVQTEISNQPLQLAVLLAQLPQLA
jgi:hypothetical protein